MHIDTPAITVYYRTIDNVTHEEVDGYKLLNSKSHFHYGKISGIDGGESQFIVELDIWNNESAFYGGMQTYDVLDATSCKFSAWDNENLNSSMSIRNPVDNRPYVMARCVTRDFSDFKAIAGRVSLASENLYGTINSESGILSGQHGGDHMKIQTKISIPSNTLSSFKNFVFDFSYNYS
jgi:hypothetical protein